MIKGIACFALFALAGGICRADEIADWNVIMFQAAHSAGTSPVVMNRFAAMVQASVYDAVNGIENRYAPIYVQPNAAPGASKRAAAVAAAHGILINLYPSQKSTLFDPKFAESLSSIASGPAAENSVSLARGVEWGRSVAAAVWTWRSTDGFTPNPPPYLGGTGVGEWRPTLPALSPGAVPQFAYMTPFVLQSSSQFRPAGPPALSGERYAQDLNEVKSMGSKFSLLRTPDQTLYARFWASTTASYPWNGVALALAAERHLTFSEKARLLAMLNVAMADAVIACWEAKYHYSFWRPITAIPLAESDGNSATDPDSEWAPLLGTPAFPEYPSGHSSVSAAAATVLAAMFGDNSSFTVGTDSTFVALPGVTRSFSSFSEALSEVSDSRIYGGIHFRSATDDAEAQGKAVAHYIMQNAFRSLRSPR